MVISLFVLLAWIVAVECLSSKVALQTRTSSLRAPSLSPISTDTKLLSREYGLDKRASQEAFTLCGDQQSHCADHGRPVSNPVSLLKMLSLKRFLGHLLSSRHNLPSFLPHTLSYFLLSTQFLVLRLSSSVSRAYL